MVPQTRVAPVVAPLCTQWTAQVACGQERQQLTLYSHSIESSAAGNRTVHLESWAPDQIPTQTVLAFQTLSSKVDIHDVWVEFDPSGTPVAFGFQPHIEFKSSVRVRTEGLRKDESSNRTETPVPIRIEDLDESKFSASVEISAGNGQQLRIDFDFYPANLV